jgi:2-keto-4-pentenoate hydratase/2-oxohepta-3-ene-1,7-dioic acid hydratase in catechol pathway
MKLVSFKTAGAQSYGVISDGGIIDLGRRIGERYPTLRTAIAGDVLSKIENEVPRDALDVQIEEVSLLAPIPDPHKIICIGLNYRAHAAEAGLKVPENPSLFLRLTNTLVPHDGSMICPKLSTDMDFEGELALIIGKGGRHIAKEDALKHIAGYSCFNDGSLRDYQFKHSLAVG